MSPHPPQPAIAEVILGVARPGQARRWLTAALVALGLHGALWLSPPGHGGLSEPASAAAASKIAVAPVREVDLDIADPPARPASDHPHAEPRRAPQPPAPSMRRERHAAPRGAPRAVQPAQAAAVVAREPSASDPVDLTGDTFVVGAAAAHAGGVTSSSGTGTRPGVARGDSDGETGRPPGGGQSSGPDGSSGVALADESWSCPWPRDADAEQINEQTVVIRVVVGAAGQVESAEVVSDPGHGFAQAAAACAMRTRFTPSRARDGRAIRARSPPIKVRFTR